MSEVVIEVNNLSKKYKIGTIGTGTLSNDLNQWWAKFRGKEDPYSKLDEINNLELNKEYYWALRNMDFKVNQGDILGIIGKNGAGKSTLLKILSRVTTPTAGEVKIKGRISSLLEVGTGFHPELTGKENVFLNGAILGMTRKEVKKKLEEIIDFSGVGEYIDTPVKRYSSGMYVRLAFAVAAHLETEILIIDEVLAVGDAEFQKKCLGKIGEISDEGRTILFVSHNMTAVKNLCSKILWIDKGKSIEIGDKKVINKYLSASKVRNWHQEWENIQTAPGNDNIKVLSVDLSPSNKDHNSIIDVETSIKIKFTFITYVVSDILNVDLILFNTNGDCIFDIPSTERIGQTSIITAECEIPGNFLNDGSYYFSLYFGNNNSEELFFFQNCLSFDVEDNRDSFGWYEKWWGSVRPKFPFKLSVHDTSTV